MSVFPTYDDDRRALRRLNARWRIIAEPVMDQIAGARMLDLAAHDGRWSYAFAHAGAERVTAVEPRAELVSRFSEFPKDDCKARVDFICDDAFSFLTEAVANDQTFDVIAILGFLYHTMEHARLFNLVRQLQPRLIMIDSEFIDVKNGIIQMTSERTDNPLNAVGGPGNVLVGTPSVGAMRRFAHAIGYDLRWRSVADMRFVSGDSVNDYLREGRKRRMVCYLSRG